MWVYGNVCCVTAVVNDNGVLSLGVLYMCVRDVMNVVFSVCIVKRGAASARAREV